MTDFIFCDSISMILYISELIDFINNIYFETDPQDYMGTPTVH